MSEAKKTLEENIRQPKHTPETVRATTSAPCKYKNQETPDKASQLQRQHQRFSSDNESEGTTWLEELSADRRVSSE